MHRLPEGFKCKVAEGGVFGMTVDLGILDYRLQIDCSFPTVLGSLD